MKTFLSLFLITACCSCGYITGQESATYKQADTTVLYTFTFIDSTWLFKGKPFKLEQPIGYYVDLFGPYDRATSVSDSIYTWDSLGIMLAIPHNAIKAIDTLVHLADRIYVVFDYDFQNGKVDSNLFSDEQHKEWEISRKESTREENDARPHPFFRGSINVGNAALHKNMTANELDIEIANAFVAKKTKYYMEFSHHRALPSFYYCEYNYASHPFEYVFHLNDKGKIEEFQLDIMDSYKETKP